MKMLIKKIPDTIGLVITTVLNTNIKVFDNKLPNTSSLVTSAVLKTKISEAENKISDNSKHTTTQEFNKAMEEYFAAKLMKADLMNKTHFDLN